MRTLTLKNIPERLHAELKACAERNRRSLNSEILVRLEAQFAAPAIDGERAATELKAFTDRLPYVDHRVGDRAKRRGLK